MRSLYVLWLLTAITVTACTKHNPAVCCETPGECAVVGFDDPQPCQDSVCVFNACVQVGCDGPEDCHDPAKPLCVANQCEAPAPDPPAPDWVTRIGGPGNDGDPAISTFQNGDLVIAAGFTGTISLGGNPLVASGSEGTWVARFATDGSVRWSTVLGDAGNSQPYTIGVDANDGVYIAGSFQGPISFGGGVHAGTGHFLVKLQGANGTYQWDTVFDSTVFPSSVVVPTADVAVMLAQFTGTVDLGQGPRTSTPASSPEGILVGFQTSSGTPLWSNVLTTSGDFDRIGQMVSVDGDVVVTSGFNGTATLGGPPLVAAGELDMYVARFRSDGSHVWSRRWGATGEMWPTPLATDGNRIFIGGWIVNTGNLGGADIPGGDDTGFVAAYDALDGHYLWDQSFPGSGSSPRVLTLAANASRLTAGISTSSAGTVTVGDRSFTSQNSAVVIAGLYPESGQPTPSATLFASLDPRALTTMSLTYSNDRLAGCGVFGSEAELFGMNLRSAGSRDIAVFRVDF